MAEQETQKKSKGSGSACPKSKRHHVALIVFEVFLVVAFALFAVLGYGAWRIHKAPLDLAFAKNYLQEQLRNSESGIYSHIGEAVLHWPDLKGPILIGLHDVHLYDAQDHEILTIDDVALGVSRLHLFLGQAVPVALIIRKTDLHITRSADNAFSFGFGAGVTHPEPESADDTQSDLIARVISYLLNEDSDKDEASPLAHLKSIKLQNARLMIDDHVSNTQWTVPRFDIRGAQTRKGLEYGFDLYFEMDADGSSINGYGDFNRVSKGHNFAIDVNNLSMDLVADKVLQKSNFQPPLGAMSAQVKGVMAYEEDLMRVPMQIKVEQAQQRLLRSLWPEGFEEEAITEWLTDKISGGKFYDVRSDLTLTAAKDEDAWQFDVQDFNLDFAFVDTNIRYLDRLAPAERVEGQGRLDAKSDTLRIDVESADIQGMSVKDARIELFDVMAVGKDSAKIEIPVQSALDDVFRFIEQERIGVNHGFDLETVKGNTEFTVNVDLPELRGIKVEDVLLDIEGRGEGGYLPSVVRGLDLSEFTYTATLKDNVLDVVGNGRFDKRDVDVSYKRVLEMAEPQEFKTRIEASLVGDNVLLNKLGIELDDFVQGTFPVSVVYMDGVKEGGEKATVRADLTSSVLQIDPFQYKKPVEQNAVLDLVARLENERVTTIDSLNLTAPNLKIKDGRVGFTAENDAARFASLTLPDGVLGRSKGAFSLLRTQDDVLDFKFNGDVFDLYPFLDRDAKKRNENEPITLLVNANALLTSESEQVSQGKIIADIDAQGRFDRLEVNAVAGRGDFSLRYSPDTEGKRTFDLRAQDAGAALNVFSVYDKIRGGELVIHGQARTGSIYDRTINGTAQITDFRVRKTPVLGRLLSALSLPGLLQLLDGDGLVFEKMATEFTWEYRSTGSLLKLKNGRTSGNSLGLTFDGTIDHTNNKIDIEGTIIPLSGLNKTIGDIPIIGDLLTGGSGSVFAATYTIKGSLDDPEVFVNPLSVLTPGILRRVLFEQD